ncbi:hypothetical protein BT93_B0929 [Corymbia citriodora subsp. variegata]|nr:hypothetical protein BT93_B0929 [Corymbia citriodora subsp. variegata]
MVDNIGAEDGCIKEQDRLLPIANVGRIMKQILPSNAKVSKEAKETMQECVSEFISFVTSEASEKCWKERRKTVSGDDICCAMEMLGLDNYAGPLRRYLYRYRDLEGEKPNQQKPMNNNSGSNDVEQSWSYRNTQQYRNNQGLTSTSANF